MVFYSYENFLFTLMQNEHWDELKLVAQLTFICSKSTVETLEKGAEYVQS